MLSLYQYVYMLIEFCLHLVQWVCEKRVLFLCTWKRLSMNHLACSIKQTALLVFLVVLLFKNVVEPKPNCKLWCDSGRCLMGNIYFFKTICYYDGLNREILISWRQCCIFPNLNTSVSNSPASRERTISIYVCCLKDP